MFSDCVKVYGGFYCRRQNMLAVWCLVGSDRLEDGGPRSGYIKLLTLCAYRMYRIFQYAPRLCQYCVYSLYAFCIEYLACKDCRLCAVGMAEVLASSLKHMLFHRSSLPSFLHLHTVWLDTSFVNSFKNFKKIC